MFSTDLIVLLNSLSVFVLSLEICGSLIDDRIIYMYIYLCIYGFNNV